MKLCWVTLVILLGIAVAASPAFAKEHGRDKDNDRDDHRVEHRDRDHDDARPWRRDRDHDRDHDRDEHHFRRTHGEPAGWSHGKKKGWGNCDVPPGQAKKVGCHPYHHHVSDYHTAKRAPKPVVVRRPSAEVHAHAGVDAQVH